MYKILRVSWDDLWALSFFWALTISWSRLLNKDLRTSIYIKTTCLEEIGLRAQNMMSILHPIVNICFFGFFGWGGGLYEYLLGMRILMSVKNAIHI